MSSRRDGSFVRSERLMLIAKHIAYNITQEKQCIFEDLIVWIQFDMGLTDKTSREYVSIVLRAKGWRLNDGIITFGEVG